MERTYVSRLELLRDEAPSYVTADDVAAYIVERAGGMPYVKLIKLVYYSQAWALVWADRPLFLDPIVAAFGGPDILVLRERNEKQYLVSAWPWGNATVLSDDDADTVDVVLKHYGKWTSQQLGDLIRNEQPYKEARAGVSLQSQERPEMSLAVMHEYYASIRDD